MPAVSPTPAAVVELALLGELRCDAALFPLAGRTFVACGRALMVLDEAGVLRSEAPLSAGLELDTAELARTELIAMAGQWPAAVWAVTGQALSERNATKLRFLRWRKDHWASVGASVEQGMAEARVVFPWREDGLAAVIANAFKPTRSLVFAAKPAALPALTLAVQSKHERAEYPCQHAMIAPEAWAELSSGDVMVFSGRLCGVPSSGASAEGSSFGLERLQMGEKHGQVSAVPAPRNTPRDMSWNVVGAAALSPDDVLVATTGIDNQRAPDEPFQRYAYFAHWDGNDWRQKQSPFAISAGLWAVAGAFWATDQQGALWSRRGERWSPVEWKGSAPPAATPGVSSVRGQISQFVSDAAGRLWLMHRAEQPGADTISRIYRVRIAP